MGHELTRAEVEQWRSMQCFCDANYTCDKCRALSAHADEVLTALLAAWDALGAPTGVHSGEAIPATGREHELKCWVPYFAQIWRGRKTFEVRKNDRAYMVGDVLWLREFDMAQGKDGAYTGRSLRAHVTYVLAGGAFGIALDHVVLALSDISGRSPAIEAALPRAEGQHVHVAKRDVNDDLLDECGACGEDLRHPIHKRSIP